MKFVPCGNISSTNHPPYGGYSASPRRREFISKNRAKQYKNGYLLALYKVCEGKNPLSLGFQLG